MIATPARFDSTQYTVQYELLRSQVIGAAGIGTRGNMEGQPRGLGLALLLSEGMPGWLKTIEAVLRTMAAPVAIASPDLSVYEVPPSNSAAPVWLPSVQRCEVTTLLASLVLSTRPVLHSSSREGYRPW